MVTPRVTRALNPHKRRRNLTLKQIRAGFGGKRRLASLKASKTKHHRPRTKANHSKPRKAKRRASSNPSARTLQKRLLALEKKLARKKYKAAKRAAKKGRRINPSKPKRKATAKRRRSSNPGPYLLTMSPVGNPKRKRRKSNMAKAKRKVSAKGRSRKSNPTRRRSTRRRATHRSRNPMDTSLLKKGFGVFIGFSAAKKVPPMLGASMNSSPTMTLLSTAITAGVFAWAAKKFIPGPIAEGVLWGGVGGVINMAWNAWAPASIAGYAGVGDFVAGRFPLPQGPVRYPMALPPPAQLTPTGSQVNVGAFGRAW